MNDPIAATPNVAPRLYDRLVVWGFIAFLFLPVAWRGAVRPRPIPGTPRLLADVQNISCLFSSKPNVWNSFYLQARFEGYPRWVELDQAELFPMRPFGRRTRMHRFFAEWHAKRGPKTEEMARFVFRRYAELHPDEAQPEAIRFARATTKPDPGRPPLAGWSHPRWSDVTPGQREVIVAYPRKIAEP